MKTVPPAPEKPKDERIRVMTYGKTWAQLLRQDPESLSYLMFSVGTPGYYPSQKDFEAIREQEPLEFYNNLTEQSNAASSWVLKLQYYVRKANIVLIDTDSLDSAVGQEILRNAQAFKVPAYAVGVSANTSPIAPYYVKGIVFPGTTKELHDLIRQVTAAKPTLPKPTPQPSRGEPIRKSETPPPPPAEPTQDALETL